MKGRAGKNCGIFSGEYPLSMVRRMEVTMAIDSRNEVLREQLAEIAFRCDCERAYWSI